MSKINTPAQRARIPRVREATVSAVATVTALLASHDLSAAAAGNAVRVPLAGVAQAPPQAASQPAAPQTPPPQSPPTSASPSPPPPPEGTPATVVDGQELESILGKSVSSPTGEDMGRIVDVMVDRSGQMRAAIIDFGGFLGVGSRKIALDWSLIHFPSDGKTDNVVVELNRNQLRLAPIYKPGDPVVLLGRPAIAQ